MNRIDEILNRPQALTFQVVLASALGATAIIETINNIADREWTVAAILGVTFLALAYLAAHAMGIIEYRMEAGQSTKVRRAAEAEVANAFVRWGIANEIGEPIDWVAFGQIAEQYSPLHENYVAEED